MQMQRVKILVLAAIMLLSAAGAAAQKKSSGESEKVLFRQALDLYQKEKYASAQNLFDKLAAEGMSVDEQMAGDACYYGAVCAEKLTNKDADFRLQEFLRLYPQSKHCNMANFYLGNYHYAAGDYKKALKYYVKVQAREVEYGHRSEYNFKVGYCYFSDEQYDDAKKYFAQEINGKSKYTNAALYYYAHLQYMDGKYDLALRNFQKLQSDRKFAKIVPSYIARIYYYLGKNDELLEMAPVLLSSRRTKSARWWPRSISTVATTRMPWTIMMPQCATAPAMRNTMQSWPIRPKPSGATPSSWSRCSARRRTATIR